MILTCPSGPEMLNGAVGEQYLLFDFDSIIQQYGLDPEANHPNRRFVHDCIRQYAPEFPRNIRADEPAIFIAHGPQEALRRAYGRTARDAS
ncbi:MAG: hypothetical protein IMZ61_16065 [Planctomycetes bacterium]|nr:hypothetical protein [Planctomycetota bacterium]